MEGGNIMSPDIKAAFEEVLRRLGDKEVFNLVLEGGTEDLEGLINSHAIQRLIKHLEHQKQQALAKSPKHGIGEAGRTKIAAAQNRRWDRDRKAREAAKTAEQQPIVQ